MRVRPAILIIENEQILTMQYRYGVEDVYNLPGGNLEFGEKMTEAIIREMHEELMIEVEVGELKMLGEIHFPEQENYSLHCIFAGKILSGKPTLNPKHTSALSVKWLKISELDKFNLYPNVTESIQKLLKNELSDKYLGKINQKWF